MTVELVSLFIAAGVVAAGGWYALSNRIGGESRLPWRRRKPSTRANLDGDPNRDTYADDMLLHADPNLYVNEVQRMPPATPWQP